MELINSIPAESPTTKEQQEVQAQVVRNKNEGWNDLQQKRQEEKVFAQFANSKEENSEGWPLSSLLKEMDEKQTIITSIFLPTLVKKVTKSTKEIKGKQKQKPQSSRKEEREKDSRWGAACSSHRKVNTTK